MDVDGAPRGDAVPAERLDWLRHVESMDEGTARRRLRRRLRADATRARSEVRSLRPWPAMPPNVGEMLQRDGEIVRLHHLVGAVPEGARVLDVGCGPGVVGGTLALHGRLDAYLGVDLSEAKIESARAMAVANDLSPAIRFEVGDATALPVGRIDELGPDTVLLLEVLEHLREPAAVLASVADAVPDGTRILFSVPILGRIEACWGHRTLFGADAVVGLADAAGVDLETVDEVHNTWAVATVSRSRPRSGHSTHIGPAVIEHRTAEQVVVHGAEHTVQRPPSRLEIVVPPRATVHLDATTPGADWVRLDLGLVSGPHPRVEVATTDVDGEPVRSWPTDLDRRSDVPRATTVFRPGDATLHDRASERPVTSTRVTLTGRRRQATVQVWRIGFAVGYGELQAPPRRVGPLHRLARRIRR